MNHMAEVAKLLSVELGERFKLGLIRLLDMFFLGLPDLYLVSAG